MDIVERLRDAAPIPTGLYCEAADEIEQLRGTIATLNESLTITSQGNSKLRQQVAEAFNAGLEAAAKAANEASCTNRVLLSIRALKEG